MTKNTLTAENLALVGEAISHDLGAQMILDYQTANPSDVKNYYIGKEILSEILAQPNCVGIKFFNAYNESGRKTLVYVGIDHAGKAIISFSVVNNIGSLEVKKAIVADRTIDNDTDFNTWEWVSA